MRNLKPWQKLIGAFLMVGLIGGCGGSDIDDDGGYNPGDAYYPQYKDLTLVLRVVDGVGNPLGGVSVWVDEERDSTRTDSVFHPLGSGYPAAWQGWLANWTSDNYRVVMNYYGDQDQFEIKVGKGGYTSDSTLVRIYDREPDHIFVRDTMVMHRITTLETQTAPAPATREAEVINADGPPLGTLKGPRLIIGNDE